MIVSGRYEIFRDGERAGRERFQFLGHAIESVAELEQPVASRQQARVTLDTSRSPIEVTLELEMGGDATRARFRIDREGATLRALVQPPAGASIERQVAFGGSAEVGFTSPIAELVTTARLRLRPGERRDVEMVRFAAGTLMPELRRTRYQRLPDVELATQAGGIVASDYLVETLDGPPSETRFQANLLGLPVRMRMQTGEVVHQYLLVE